jgi:hypothetical protein
MWAPQLSILLATPKATVKVQMMKPWKSRNLLLMHQL